MSNTVKIKLTGDYWLGSGLHGKTFEATSDGENGFDFTSDGGETFWWAPSVDDDSSPAAGWRVEVIEEHPLSSLLDARDNLAKKRADDAAVIKAAADKLDDAINPGHYNGDTVMRFIEQMELGFALGNAVKYVSRAGKKPGNAKRQELEKAIWYIQREIDRLETGL